MYIFVVFLQGHGQLHIIPMSTTQAQPSHAAPWHCSWGKEVVISLENLFPLDMFSGMRKKHDCYIQGLKILLKCVCLDISILK